jgi:hypothetical protein
MAKVLPTLFLYRTCAASLLPLLSPPLPSAQCTWQALCQPDGQTPQITAAAAAAAAVYQQGRCSGINQIFQAK